VAAQDNGAAVGEPAVGCWQGTCRLWFTSIRKADSIGENLIGNFIGAARRPW